MTRSLVPILVLAIAVFTCSARANDKTACPGPRPPKQGGVDFSLPCVMQPENPIAEPDRKIFFSSGSAALSFEAIAILDRQAVALKDSPSARILAKAYADTKEAPSSEEMLRLSKMRARMVRDYLIGKGIAEGRIQAVGSHGPFLIPKREDEATLSQMRVVIMEGLEK